MLKADEEVCGEKEGRRNHGSGWRWDEAVKETVRQRKSPIKR